MLRVRNRSPNSSLRVTLTAATRSASGALSSSATVTPAASSNWRTAASASACLPFDSRNRTDSGNPKRTTKA